MTRAFHTGLSEVFDRRGSSTFTLVTFGHAMATADGSSYWRQDVAEALDLDCIGIMPAFAHWYPESDMAACAAALAPRLAGRKVVLIGDGMGAYAAIRHAALFAAAAIIAIGPQISIDPADAPWDARFRGFFRPALHAGMSISAAHRTGVAPFILHDGQDTEDRRHCAAIAAIMPIRPIPMTWTGAQAVHVLAGSEPFHAMLNCALAGDAAGMTAVVRAHKKTNRFYLGRLGAACLRRDHPMWSEAILRRARDAGTGMADILWLRAHAHRQAGHWALAEADARASLALPDDDQARRADLWELIAVHLRGRGRHDEAASLLQAAIAAAPQGSAARRQLESVLAAP